MTAKFFLNFLKNSDLNFSQQGSQQKLHSFHTVILEYFNKKD